MWRPETVVALDMLLNSSRGLWLRSGRHATRQPALAGRSASADRPPAYNIPHMAEYGSIFGAMLQEFDGAARILNLEPGIWKILTHPKRQITVSCPVQMDYGE